MVWQKEYKIGYSDFFIRQKIVLIFFAILFIILSLKLFYLQIIKGGFYNDISEQQRIYSTDEMAPRGIIYADDDSVMAENAFIYSILFYPFDQGGLPAEKTILELNAILKKDIRPYLEESIRNGKIVKIADKLSMEEMFKIQEKKMKLNGITLVAEPVRVYKFPQANSHVFGYLGEINKNELMSGSFSGYKSGDYIGKAGIESVYDKYLRGVNGGWQLEVNAKGVQTKAFKYIKPEIGNSAYLTISPRLQKAAYEALAKSSTGRGAAIVIDVKTGAIKALVSAPSYDSNKVKAEDFALYLKDKNLPLYNRATQALYAPGSVFKIIAFAAAVESDFDIYETKYCRGYFDLGDKRYLCWYKPGHGRVNLMEALAQSCNVYFYNLALRLGVDKLDEFSWKFRLGEQTGIDLPNEKRGFVPTAEWKKSKEKVPWLQGDTVNFGIGQGALWVTPLQMAAMMSAVANRGTHYKPYVVNKIVSLEGEQIYQHSVETNGSVTLKSRTWDLLHQALIDTVEKGTARGAFFPNIKIAGKTGTAQNPQGNDHAWFVSFAPADDPEIAIAVIVENGGGGSANAVPIGRKIYEAYFFEGEYKIKSGD
ncbi:MAG: penicillin-binding protein 2 [Elusimicrobiota bacterium]|jgi:penicillin-binding protein 2|nr:penicillin-binding protein 2 [Elusimicrobiota bacterium]